MATVDRWLLPDGIEEVLPPEAARIEIARRQVLDLFQSWGYELVVTPHIEYGIAAHRCRPGPDQRTFKVVDPQSGRLMGFRADFTPQVARIDAHTLRREGPSRLCYAGSVLHAQPRALSTSRSPIQLGAELYGDASPTSDVEVISLMLATLQLTDVADVHMDLGHVGIYRGLARAAGLSGSVEQQLFDALQRKAVDEVQALTADLPKDLGNMLRALTELCGGREVLAEARVRLGRAPASVLAALDDLLAIADRLAARYPDLPLYFDRASCAAITITPAWCSPCSFRRRSVDRPGRTLRRHRRRFWPGTPSHWIFHGFEDPGHTGASGGRIAFWRDLDARQRRHGPLADGLPVAQRGPACGPALPGQPLSAALEADCDRQLIQQDGRWQVLPLTH